MEDRTLRYQTFLLRCWEECDETTETLVWRFSLEESRTGKRRGFASLMDLMTTLQTELFNPRRLTADNAKGEKI
ncbi:MAG: hypothetical protein Fur0022_04660 [Anaerolineales bacterium]